jgi:hypothetical protein
VYYLAVEVVVVLQPDSAGRLAVVHLAGESFLGAAAVHAQHCPANKKIFSRQKNLVLISRYTVCDSGSVYGFVWGFAFRSNYDITVF